MATLILTAVGSAIGGPIGGAIGSIIGQQIDQNVFAPKARRGPRLGDLAVQTSTYGSEIPKIFGTMRVAGTVIWATDLIESRSRSGGGKGRPSTIAYSYAANFAVALSGRPLRTVRRIWADGKLLRGAVGDFKTETGYRLHLGDEVQAVDPLIASAEGIAETPAFRGIAYAVFENFQLEDYGNRIPSLTFEVEADVGAVTIGEIAAALAHPAIVAGTTPALTGYAAAGDSVRSAVAALADVVPLSLVDRDGALRISGEVEEAPTTIGAHEDSGWRQIVRQAAGSIAGEVSLAYYDADRDFQTGLQRATVGGPPTRHADRRGLAAAMSAAAAKALAEYRLGWLRTGRVRAQLKLGWARGAVRPGDRLVLAGETGLWRVQRLTLGAMTMALDLMRVPGSGPPDPVAASSGTPVRQPDLVHGPTVLRLFDLPLGETGDARPLLFAAAAGVQPGWRRAGLLASFDGGANWQDAGPTALPAVMGETLTVPEAAGSALFDLISRVDVELLSDAMWLENADEDGLAAGANLALVGDELIQFGTAEWLGGRRFRLSRLLRGRRGTEWAGAGHVIGEPFTLVEQAAMAVIEAPVAALGGEARLTASGVGDAIPAEAAREIGGESLRPPAPVHLQVMRTSEGDIMIQWVRRSRAGWFWPSEGETPLGEESEAYRLVLSGTGFTRTVTASEPDHAYTAAQQIADGLSGPLQISVSQIGTFAVSRTATVMFE